MDLKQSFIEEPRRAFVQEAAEAAVDPSPPAAKAERAWERANPEGQVDTIDGGIVLWNFAVGESELKPQHRLALELFAPSAREIAHNGGAVLVEGHASASGEESENQKLSEQRALAVFMFLLVGTSRKVPGSAMKPPSGAGRHQPLGASDSGESLARNRRVEVTLIPADQAAPNGGVNSLPILPRIMPYPASGTPDHGDPAIESRALEIPFGRVLKIPFGPTSWKTPVGDLRVSGEVQLLKESLSERDKVLIETRPDRIQLAAEHWFFENFRIKTTSDRIAFGWQANKWALVELELAMDPEEPYALALTMIPPEFDQLNVTKLGPLKIQIVALKVRVSFIPNAYGMWLLRQWGARLASRVAPWLARAASAAGVAGAALAIVLAYLGWIVWGFWNIVEAHREGREHGMLVRARRGYAQYLSCALTETDLSICATNIESLQWGEERVAAALGWEAAHAGWQEWSDSSEKAELAKRLGGRKGVPSDVREKVFMLVGGQARDGALPHPRELLRLTKPKQEVQP